jgi:hypothetical protein
MKDGKAIRADKILMLRHIEVTGCTYPTTQGELEGALLTIQAGPKTAQKTYRFFVSLQSMLPLGELLTKAAQEGIRRTTPAPGPKH